MEWIQDQIRILKSYEGCNIEKVMIYEMALLEGDEGRPIFEHPELPFIQAHVIYFFLNGSKVIKILTYQNDCEWGIYSTDLENISELEVKKNDDAFFRLSVCDEFPLGIINSVSSRLNDNGDISEVQLIVNSKEVLLKSGEVYENYDGTISTRSDDESVLVFLNSEDVSRVKFNT
jgi:hypothetical protein